MAGRLKSYFKIFAALKCQILLLNVPRSHVLLLTNMHCIRKRYRNRWTALMDTTLGMLADEGVSAAELTECVAKVRPG